MFKYNLSAEYKTTLKTFALHTFNAFLHHKTKQGTFILGPNPVPHAEECCGHSQICKTPQNQREFQGTLILIKPCNLHVSYMLHQY